MTASALKPAPAALAIAVIGASAILGAYFFEYVMKLAPCPLCLDQRIPYYIGILLALAIAFGAARGLPPGLVRLGFAALAIVFLVGAGLGIYHAGIEWKFWLGPASCSGPLQSIGTGGDLLSQMQAAAVVRCDEAAWRLFGISLAGYNVLISVCLTVIALCAIWRRETAS